MRRNTAEILWNRARPVRRVGALITREVIAAATASAALVLLFLVAWMPLIMIGAFSRGARSTLLILFIIPVLVLLADSGRRAFQTARRMRSPSGSSVLRWDTRPPILYLRAFTLDTWELAPTEFEGWFPVEFGAPREEEILARVFGAHGPVVALSRPGERLPPLGAARLKVDNWQDEVLEILSRAQLVLVTLSTSRGVAWEIEQLVARAEPRRVLLHVPDPIARNYALFRASLERMFPGGLPGDVVQARFIQFDDAWRPQPLAGSPRPATRQSVREAAEQAVASIGAFLHPRESTRSGIVRALRREAPIFVTSATVGVVGLMLTGVMISAQRHAPPWDTLGIDTFRRITVQTMGQAPSRLTGHSDPVREPPANPVKTVRADGVTWTTVYFDALGRALTDSDGDLAFPAGVGQAGFVANRWNFRSLPERHTAWLHFQPETKNAELTTRQMGAVVFRNPVQSVRIRYQSTSNVKTAWIYGYDSAGNLVTLALDDRPPTCCHRWQRWGVLEVSTMTNQISHIHVDADDADLYVAELSYAQSAGRDSVRSEPIRFGIALVNSMLFCPKRHSSGEGVWIKAPMPGQ